MASVKIRFKGRSPKKMAYEIETKAAKNILAKVRKVALEHFDDNFVNQGWDGQPWRPRKAPNCVKDR